ncbi:hypothetical protein [Roseomonas elaeocarpi]|uniref:Uncharacterized protein n=1 Tax=Roseomonas elaeocarpi TaxID=907779 RepID=A0ABV6K0D2_9PROT
MDPTTAEDAADLATVRQHDACVAREGREAVLAEFLPIEVVKLADALGVPLDQLAPDAEG